MENSEKNPGKCDRCSFIRFCVITIVVLVVLQLFYSNDIYEQTSRMVQMLNFQRKRHTWNSLTMGQHTQSNNETEKQYNFTLCNNITCNNSSIHLNTDHGLSLCPKTPPKLGENFYHFWKQLYSLYTIMELFLKNRIYIHVFHFLLGGWNTISL